MCSSTNKREHTYFEIRYRQRRNLSHCFISAWTHLRGRLIVAVRFHTNSILFGRFGRRCCGVLVSTALADIAATAFGFLFRRADKLRKRNLFRHHFFVVDKNIISAYIRKYTQCHAKQMEHAYPDHRFGTSWREMYKNVIVHQRKWNNAFLASELLEQRTEQITSLIKHDRQYTYTCRRRQKRSKGL